MNRTHSEVAVFRAMRGSEIRSRPRPGTVRGGGSPLEAPGLRCSVARLPVLSVCAAWLFLMMTLLTPQISAYEGFGASTPGGIGGAVVNVTSLADSGPGSLREALRAGRRFIHFSVGGTIRLRKALSVKDKSFVTIDGSTAPSPGITLEGHGISISNSHDIVIQSIRVRNSARDGVSVKNGSYNVLIHRCSLASSADENLGITNDSRDVTVSWSIIGDGGADSFIRRSKGMLVANFNRPPVNRISIHHNWFAHQAQRSPQISTAGLFDLRNNVISNWSAYGVRVRNGAWGNIVANVFKTVLRPRHAIELGEDAGPVFIRDNRGAAEMNLDGQSTAPVAFEVATVTTDRAEAVAQRLLLNAGVFPRDGVDSRLLTFDP